MKFKAELNKLLILRERPVEMRKSCYLRKMMIWILSWKQKNESLPQFKLLSKT